MPMASSIPGKCKPAFRPVAVATTVSAAICEQTTERTPCKPASIDMKNVVAP
ncbi:hypothetical protein D3C76_1541380 [compost metagenome]